MKKKVLCVALALLMCLLVCVPAFADGEEKEPQERAGIILSYNLSHVSGSTYRMWAHVINVNNASVSVSLFLYNASHSFVAFASNSSFDYMVNVSKDVTLSSGTYYLRIICTVNGLPHEYEKSVNI